jgi:hypothetical protein
MGQQIGFALKDSMHRVLVKLVSFLPGLLALLVAVVVLTAVGMLLAFLIRRLLTAAKFDERFARSQTADVTDWSPGHSPTVLIARIAFWVCVLLGFMIGISAFDASYSGSSQIAPILLPVLTRAVEAVLILLAGTVIARYLSRSVLIGAVNLQMQYARFLSMGVKWLVLVLTAAMALDHLQIGGVVVELAFGILFGGIVLTLTLAIGLGSRDLVSRSLEKTAEPRGTAGASHDDPFAESVPGAASPQPRTPETLRHF